jgi:hypothetical protein
MGYILLLRVLKAVAAFSVSLTLLSACQSSDGRLALQPDEKLLVSKAVWDYYQTYLQAIDGGSRGAFAVSDDGYYATYSYCSAAQACFYNINYSASAIKSCQSKGNKCIVFAKNDEIIIPYAVAE